MPATKPPPAFAITLSGESSRASGAPTKGDDGVMRQRFTKDAIRVGEYRHPKHGWKLKPDASRLDHWCDTFKKMLANGVDVEVFADHTKDGKSAKGERADKIRGYVKDIFREGDVLNIVHDAEGEAGISLARTCKNVSIEIDDFADSQGNKYPDAITAVAFVEKPVVPNQEPCRIAASLVDDKGKPREIPNFTLAVGDPPSTETTSSEDLTMLIKAVAELTGTQCTTADEAIAALKTWKPTGTPPAPATVAASLCESVGPDVSEMLAEGAEAQLSLLADEGRITPAVKDKLHGILIGATGARKTLSLSPTASKALGDRVPLAKDIIAALKELPQLVKTNGDSKTGPQTFALSRATPGDEGKFDAEAESKALREREKRRNPRAFANSK